MIPAGRPPRLQNRPVLRSGAGPRAGGSGGIPYASESEGAVRRALLQGRRGRLTRLKPSASATRHGSGEGTRFERHNDNRESLTKPHHGLSTVPLILLITNKSVGFRPFPP